MSQPLSRPLPGAAEAHPHWVIIISATTLAYILVGVAALRLSIPPDYASPLFPSAGIALAAVLTYGWRALPAVALGSFGTNIALREGQVNFDPATLAVPLAIAAGASLQAVAGSWLVRRFVRQPLTLGEPRDIAAFFGLGAVLACTVSASIATATLVLAGFAAPGAPLLTWLTWWTGDTLGVLIGAPIALTLIGRPRSAWVPRRLNVGLTLALVTGFIAVGILRVAQWDEERAHNAFVRDADNVAAAFRARLQEPLHALEAMRGVFIASDSVSQVEMHRASRAWLESGTLYAVGWSERITRTDMASYQARVQKDGLPGYRVFDRVDLAPAELVARDRDAVVIRYIEPMDRNASALGVNALSVPVAREAIEAAALSGRPHATSGFRLTQRADDRELTGVVVYSAVSGQETPGGSNDLGRLRGVVFVTLRTDQLLEPLASLARNGMQICVLDRAPGATVRRLAGPARCEATSVRRSVTRDFVFAGRQWELVVLNDAPLTRAATENTWLFALIGLLAASMLGALLLTVTGRTRRIEEAVAERTSALEDEMTVRARAQAALEESQERLRNILDNVPIGIIYTDLNGRIIEANPRFCAMTGYGEPELLRMSSADYTHEDDRAEDVALSRRLLSGELAAYRRQKRCVTQDGRTVWVQSTVSLLRDAHGEPRFIVGAVEDITERRRLQDAEHAREVAEAANRAKSEFLSRMSHELRTPMNAILGFAQLLDLDQQQPIAASQRPWVHQIQQAGWHLLEMINDVLDLSRIESGHLKLRSETLNLCQLVVTTVPMIRAEAQSRAIEVTTAMQPAACAVRGDPTRIRQILINLLSNAVKYNVDGGRVEVLGRRVGADRVELEVADTGIGMSEQQLADLYKPFNRLGREATSRSGTGIGLVISRSLAELMDGTLRVRSEVGQGTSFVLELPAGEATDVADDGKPGGGESDAQAAQPDYSARFVHYIEDNETNVEVMRGILAQRPQITLSVSLNGTDGLAAVRAHLPDLILLDMHLPDMNGRDVLAALKCDPVLSAVPVVAVSADAVPAHIEAALQAGAAHYLTKPVNIAALLAIIDEQVGTTDFGALSAASADSFIGRRTLPLSHAPEVR